MTLRIRQHLRRINGALLVLMVCVVPPLCAQKFYPDDPLEKEPPPRNVSQVLRRRLSDYYDFFHHTFATPGERQSPAQPIPAQNANTLGEVPDSTWYTNRHYRNPLSTEELTRGVSSGNAPDPGGVWTVIAAKSEGITPGFTIRDARGRRYVMKFDPLDSPEITTAAEMISSKFFHALGYFVPENYLVRFGREQLALGEGVELRDSLGNPRPMTDRDITEILLNVPREEDGRYRAVASLFISGENVGPFRFYGTRRDDPNDIVPHEHRRDLRGLSVFAAWLGHDDSRAVNTADFVVEESGVRYLKHYLIDFGSTLGSASTGPNSPRSGFEYLFSWREPALQFFTFGLFVPEWAKAKYPDLPAVGRFESERFDAAGWVPEYPNPAFRNRLPDDEFWAAKQVMNFTDEQIRAVVRSGEYSDSQAEQWVVKTLIERRDKIGKAFLTKVLPLDRFRIENGRLVFVDLAARHGLAPARGYSVRWFAFDNGSEARSALAGATAYTLPPAAVNSSPGAYFAAEIRRDNPERIITVYIRNGESGTQVVGIDRTW
jgi:hypothetical protein